MLMLAIAAEYPALSKLAISASESASNLVSFGSFLAGYPFNFKPEFEWAIFEGFGISTDVVKNELQIGVIPTLFNKPLAISAVGASHWNFVVIGQLSHNSCVAVLTFNLKGNDVAEFYSGSRFNRHAVGALL